MHSPAKTAVSKFESGIKDSKPLLAAGFTEPDSIWLYLPVCGGVPAALSDEDVGQVDGVEDLQQVLVPPPPPHHITPTVRVDHLVPAYSITHGQNKNTHFMTRGDGIAALRAKYPVTNTFV